MSSRAVRERRTERKGRKIPRAMLEYRERAGRGKIMRPETFEEIKRKAAASGATDPEAVAGAAYWKTLRAKFRNRKKK